MNKCIIQANKQCAKSIKTFLASIEFVVLIAIIVGAIAIGSTVAVVDMIISPHNVFGGLALTMGFLMIEYGIGWYGYVVYKICRADAEKSND